jgi:uncharacterized membrane protein YhaH (DUF805 family)
MATRFTRYLRNLFRIAVTLAVIVLVLAGIQAIFHPFDELIAKGLAFVGDLDSRLTREAFNGITLGSLVLIVGLCVFPLFLRRIDEKAYARGLWRGVISASVFYISNQLFAFASRIGRVHFIVVMLAVIIVSAIVVEGISLAVKEEEEKSFRTDVVASITSGLLFGVLVKLAEYGIELLKRKM